MKYSDKLKDPRWQKRRLEILERDKWKCSKCGHEDKELHVHHLRYKKTEEPWNTPDEFLITLCLTCHEHIGVAEENLAYFHRFVILSGLDEWVFWSLLRKIEESTNSFQDFFSDSCAMIGADGPTKEQMSAATSAHLSKLIG